MSFLVAAVFILLSTVYLVIPVRKYACEKQRRAYEEEYRLFKLRSVRRHYDALRDMSYSEIEKKYDLDSIYNRIR